MKSEWMDLLRQMRAAGHAVIVWTPEELENANPRKVEERSIELGHEIIEELK